MAVQATWAVFDRGAGLEGLLQPYLDGRKVATIGWQDPDSETRLRRAGAADVTDCEAGEGVIDAADGTIDVALCPAWVAALDEDARAGFWAEVARVLSPLGFCVLRAPIAARDAATESRATAWRRAIPDAFSKVDVIEEIAFGGVSFRVSGTDDLAIVGDLSPLGASADFEIVICAKSAVTAPSFGESMLVPLAGEVGAYDAPPRR